MVPVRSSGVQVMSLIDDYEIPGIGVDQPSPRAAAIVAQRVQGRDHHGRGGPEVPARRVGFSGVPHDADVEHFLQGGTATVAPALRARGSADAARDRRL